MPIMAVFSGLPIEFVTERSIARGGLTRYKIVLVPSVSYLPAETFDALMRFTEEVGCLVVTPPSCLYDSHHRKKEYWKNLLTIKQVEIHGDLPGKDARLHRMDAEWETVLIDPADPRIPGLKIFPADPNLPAGFGPLEGVGVRQEVAVHVPHRVLARFENRQPAILEIPRGGGTLVYCAIPLKPTDYAALLDLLMDRIQISRRIRLADGQGKNAWGVEFQTAEYEGDLLLYAVNLLEEDRTVSLRSGRRIVGIHDLLTNQSVTLPLTLRPLETVLLRMKVE